MCGYRFFISASYPYPLKTIRVRITSVQTLLTAIHILSASVLLTARPKKNKKITPDIFRCNCNIGCPILILPVVFGTYVNVAYLLMFSTTTKKAKAIYLLQIAQKKKMTSLDTPVMIDLSQSAR